MPLSLFAFLGQTSRPEELATMTCRTVGFFTVAVLVFLTIAAGASPPDPVWIAGLYDAADGDDAVRLLTETVGSVDGDFYRSLSLPYLFTDLMDPQRPLHLSPLSFRHDRGPPVRQA